MQCILLVSIHIITVFFICHEILNGLSNLVRVVTASSLHRQTDATSAP